MISTVVGSMAVYERPDETQIRGDERPGPFNAPKEVYQSSCFVYNFGNLSHRVTREYLLANIY